MTENIKKTNNSYYGIVDNSNFYFSFLGISIVADVFMCAIEKITSKKKQITISSGSGDEPADVIEVQVWNGTVANLTLMALGKRQLLLRENFL